MPTNLLFMDGDKYPFGESLLQNDNINRTLVKQTLEKCDGNLSNLLKTCQVSKKLSQNRILIRLQRILEEDETICLHYEYVPIQLSRYIFEMQEKFVKQYRNEMFELASLLAQNRIVCELSMQKMGLCENYESKYFLGVDFAQKKQVNIFELKNDYIEEIKMMFQPYLNRKNTQEGTLIKKAGKNLVRVDTRMSDTQQMSANYSYNNNLIKTRKHQSIYYERTNNQQTKKRKESYMSSVSNLRLNNLYKRINQIELHVSNTKSPATINTKNIGNSGGFKMSIEGRQFLAKSSFGGTSSKRSIIELQQKQLQIYQQFNNNNNENTNFTFLRRNNINTNTSNVNEKNNVFSIMNKNQKSNFIKYPGCDQQDQDTENNVGEQSPRYRAISNNNKLQMSAHQITTNKTVKKHHNKKFSTQFPSLSDFQQPIMALTSALRISANGLDGRNQRKPNKKIQLFKQRQYSEIKSVSGNTNYIRDFMSVLEQQTSTNQRTSKNNQNENENQSIQGQQYTIKKPFQIKMQSQESIQDEGFTLYSSKMNQQTGKQMIGKNQQNFKTQSYNNISQNKASFIPNSLQDINIQSKKIKSKLSIQDSCKAPDIHERVKGVVQNSKRLIERLRQKAKKKV